MGQITSATIKMIRDYIARGEHPPLTVHEIDQLVTAWERGQPAASAEPSQITDAMVDAYLKAQADVIRKVDDMWGNGGRAASYLHPVRESCRAGLQAALGVAAQDDETLADTQRAIIEAAEQRGYARALAECGLDAERYRWLRNEAVSEPFGDDTKAPVVFNVDDCYQHDDADLLQGEALDAAIDAAHAAKGADND